MPNLGIVVDADACIPERIRTDLGILSAPLHAPLLEGNETVMDLRHDADPPDPDAVAAACVRAAEESDTVLYVTVTDGNADNGASAARAAAAVGARARVVHYPSGDALMACGWQAIAAAVAARDTASAGHACEAAQEAARAAANRVHVLAMLEHPERMNVGGALGGLRRRRALVRLRGGDVEVIDRVTGRSDALVSLRDSFAEQAGAGEGYLRVAVHHAGAAAAADAMMRWVEQELSPEEIVIAPLTRHAAARFGPGMLAFAWYREPRS